MLKAYLCKECAPIILDKFIVGPEITGRCENPKCPVSENELYLKQTAVRLYMVIEEVQRCRKIGSVKNDY